MQNHKKVISSDPGVWSFCDYFEGNNPIEEWYQQLSEEACYLFDSLLKDLSKTANPVHWGGFRGFLEGKLKQERIWELGFKADKRQYRLLGIFGTERKQAVLLIGCYHKSRNYTPTNALDTAYKRAKALQAGKATLHERKIRTDL